MRALATAFSLLLVALGPASAAGQEEGDDSLERAVVLFQESETLYNQGEFAQAAAMLERAYTLHPDPTLLFNLARAQEGMGDLDGAIANYERYLQEAQDAPDAGAIRGRVATLREQRSQLEVATSAAAPPATSEDPSDGGAEVEIAPWLVAGLGAIAIGVGVPLGLLALDYGEQAREEPQMARAVSLQNEGETFAVVANVMFIAGGVIAAAGVTWGVISLVSGDDSEDEVALSFHPTGVRLDGSF